MYSTVRWNLNAFSRNKKRYYDNHGFVNRCWERGNQYFGCFSNTYQQTMNHLTCGGENNHNQLIYSDLISLSNATPNAANRTWNSFPLHYSDQSCRPQYSRRKQFIEREYYKYRSSPKDRFEENTTRNKRTTIQTSTLAIQREHRNHNPTKMILKDREIGSEIYNAGSKRTENENYKLLERGVTREAQKSGIEYLRKNCFINNTTIRKVAKSDKNETSSKMNKTPGKEFKQIEKDKTKVPIRGVTEKVDIDIKSQKKTDYDKKITVRKKIETCGMNGRSSRIIDGTQEKGFKLTEKGELKDSQVTEKDQTDKNDLRSLEKNNSTVRILNRIYKNEAIPKMNIEKLSKQGGTEQEQKVLIESQEKLNFETNSCVQKKTVTSGENEMKLKRNERSAGNVPRRIEKHVASQSEKGVTDRNGTKDMKLSGTIGSIEDFKLANNISAHEKKETRSEMNDRPPGKRLKLTEKNQSNLSEKQSKEQTESNKPKSHGKRYPNNNSTMEKETKTSCENKTGLKLLERASIKQQSIPSENDETNLPGKREWKSMEKNHFERPVYKKNKKLKCTSSTLGSMAWSIKPILSLVVVSGLENLSETSKVDETEKNSKIETDFQKKVSSEISNGESSERRNTEALVPEYELSSEKTGASVVSVDCSIHEDSQVKSTNEKLSNNLTSDTDTHRAERVITENNFAVPKIQLSEKDGNYVVAWKMKRADTVDQLQPDDNENKEKLATTSRTASQISDNTFILKSTEINKKLQDPRSRPCSNGWSEKIPMLLKVPDFHSRWRKRIPKIKNKDSVCCRHLNGLKKYSKISPEDKLSLCCHVIIKKNECQTAKQLSKSRTRTNNIFKNMDRISKTISVSRFESKGLKSQSTTSSHKHENISEVIEKMKVSETKRKRIISDHDESKIRKSLKLERPFPSAVTVDLIGNENKSRNTIGTPTTTNNSTFCMPESDAIERETRDKTCSSLEVEASKASSSPSRLISNTEYSSNFSENNINASLELESDINKTSGSGKSHESCTSMNSSCNTAFVNQDATSRHDDDVDSNHSDIHGCDMLIQVRVVDNPVPKVEVEETPVMRVEFFSVQSSIKSEQETAQDGGSSDLSFADNLKTEVVKDEDIFLMPKSPSIGIVLDASSENVGEIVKCTSNSETEHVGEIEIHTRMQDACYNSSNYTKNAEQGISRTAATKNKTSIQKKMTLLEEATIIAKQSQWQDASSCPLKDNDSEIKKTRHVETATISSKSLPNDIKTSIGEKVNNVSHVIYSEERKRTSEKITVHKKTEMNHHKAETLSAECVGISTKQREVKNAASNVSKLFQKKENISVITSKSKINEIKTRPLSGENVHEMTEYSQMQDNNSYIENSTRKELPETINLKTKVDRIEAEESISKEVPSQDAPATSLYEIIIPSTDNVSEAAYSSQKRDERSLDATSTKEQMKGVAKEDFNFDLRVNAYRESKTSEVPTKTKSGMNPNYNDFPERGIKEISKDGVSETDLSKNCNKDAGANASEADRTNISKIIQNQSTITHNSLNPNVGLNNTINPIAMGEEVQLTRMPILASIPTRNRKPQQPGPRFIRYQIYRLLNSYILLSYQLVKVVQSLKTIGQQFNMTPNLNHIITSAASVRALHGSFLLNCLHSLSPEISNSTLVFNSILLYLSQMIQDPKSKPMITRFIYELICCHGSRYEENRTLRNFKLFIENDLAAQRPIPGRNITSEQYFILRSQIFDYLNVIHGNSNRRSVQVPDRRCDYSPITNEYASPLPYNNFMSSPSPIATSSPRINPTLLYPSPPSSNISSPPAVISTNDNLCSTDSVQAVENMCNMEFPVADVKPSSSLMAHSILNLKEEPDEIIDLTLLDDNDTNGDSSEPTKDIVNESVELLILNNRMCLCGETAEYLCACNTVMYCSQLCQLKDWTNHRRVCSEVSNKL